MSSEIGGRDASDAGTEPTKDVSRRNLVMNLLGAAAGGAALHALTGCESPQPSENEELAVAREAIGADVASYAALRALAAPAAGTTRFVLGRNSAGDDGRGLFTFFVYASAPPNDDDGTLLKPNNYSGNGRWRRVYSGPLNVRWFGAVGDGVADDTTPLFKAALAAVTGGNILFIRLGKYRITRTLDFRRGGTGGDPASGSYDWAGLHIVGETASEDYIAGSTPQSALIWDGASSDALMRVTRGNSVVGIAFRVMSGKSASHGLRWDAGANGEPGTRIHVERCLFYGTDGVTGAMSYGIAIGAAGAVNNLEFGTFRNCHALLCTEAGFAILSTSGQSKGHHFLDCQSVNTKRGLEVNTGSFVWSNGGFQDCSIAGVDITGAGLVDTCELRNTNNERCSRWVYKSSGESTATCCLLISGGRFSMLNGYTHNNGGYGLIVEIGQPGLVEMRGTFWEKNDYTGIPVVRISHATLASHFVSVNNVYAQSAPWVTSNVLYVTTLDDKWMNGSVLTDMPTHLRLKINAWPGGAETVRTDSVLRYDGARWAPSGVAIKSGVGTPEGSVVGSVGDMYLRTDGGTSTTLYVKENGADTTSGWVGK